MKREEIEKILDSYGAKPSTSVSSKTDFVIVGDSPGSKYQKAMDLKIPIWDEEHLRSILIDLEEI